MKRIFWSLLALLTLFGFVASGTQAQTATISESVVSIATYPFGEPNDVPILTKDTRLFPYHSFEGYSLTSEMQDWKVVKLENEFIEVYVLPEVGGKVWGAIDKKTGKEFIYRNEVMKFRNIALRGPWTSGGIEFNFGVIGHTPSTATPVDYTLVTNEDGSVSCFVGTMDLPSRTTWRVEIRLEPGSSAFETNAYWHNPTSLVQPYYNWMTAAAFAQNDLDMSIPGNQFLTHPGEAKRWPYDAEGRFLPHYANNTFEGHKSYHVVGEYNDFFGGYYANEQYGFGHWARFEDLPGQKLWLWALSREGGIWDDLLTDTDGQYVEYQAGRMLVQYAPGEHDNPISKTGFPVLATDRWSEKWFPVVGTGGLTDVSDEGVLFVERSGSNARIALNVFESFSGSLDVRVNGEHQVIDVSAEPLSLWETTITAGDKDQLEIRIPELDLVFSDEKDRLALDRSFELAAEARPSQTQAEQDVFKGKQLSNARYYPEARVLFESVLATEPWNRDALVEMAQLDLRQGLFESGLNHAKKALKLDAHDAEANFLAGALYTELGMLLDARDSYSWAARSMAYRSAANTRIAEVALIEERYDEAIEFAHRAMDYDAYNVSALEVVAIGKRAQGLDNKMTQDHILKVEPLNHFARAEAMLAGALETRAFFDGLRSEFPDQTVLELAIRYASLGRPSDAAALLREAMDYTTNPLIPLWLGYLNQDPQLILVAESLGRGLANPYRVETLPVLDWAISQSTAWQWKYLKGLNLWALDRTEEALVLWKSLKNQPDHAAFYVARSFLSAQVESGPALPDLEQAVSQGDANRLTHLYLIRQYQTEGEWERATEQSEHALSLYPGDFNLELQLAKSLLFLGQSEDAVQLLENTNVLPSENARESHLLFAAAHLQRSIELLAEGQFEEAKQHIDRSLEWPEHLGQGKPYAPDERLATYLRFRAFSAMGETETASSTARNLLEMQDFFGDSNSAENLLTQDVLKRLGQPNRTSEMGVDAQNPLLDSASVTHRLIVQALNMTLPSR
ncbi:DUF5107 domain-containing protein [bacterium]|nr:DUF5107 domain-containing protein [bacterium]